MNGRIYLIRNLINGKGYVGQTTKTIAERFDTHKGNAKWGVNYALYRAIRKYGIESFVVNEVAVCDVVLLDDLEKHYVALYGTHCLNGHGYNMTEGGNSTSRPKGTKNNPESTLKSALSHKGKKHPPRTDAWRAKQRLAKLGKSPSEETRAKLSFALKGITRPPRSDVYKANMAAAKKGQNKGKPWSEARRLAEKARKK